MRYGFFFLLAVVFLSGCDKENKQECDGLKSALISNDEATVIRIVSAMIPNGGPAPTVDDSEGFRGHYNALVGGLSSCDIKAEDGCYGCIYTYPATSEIVLTVRSGSRDIRRTIDLSLNPGRTRFVCMKMHD